MTITKTGGVSHNAVLADIGYGPGSMRTRPLYNRLSRRSGNLSLDDFRGNACAIQNSLLGRNDRQYPDGWDNAYGPNLRRDVGYHGYYPQRDRYPTVFNNAVGGNTMRAELNSRGYYYYSGGTSGDILYYPGGDATSQLSFHFYINHTGTYRITGRIYSEGYTGSYNRGLFYWQVAVTSGSNGYLDRSGAFNLDINVLQQSNGSYNSSSSWDFNRTVNLTTSRPYGSMHHYGISKSGGLDSYPGLIFYFENFKMERV